MAKSGEEKYKWFLLPLIIFIAFRVIVISFLFYITKGREFTMDLWVFELGLKPLSVITFSGDAGINGFSLPPLFPFALAPLAFITSSILDRFLASRVSFTIFELIGFLIVGKYLSISELISKNAKMTALLILALSPIGIMAGSIMNTEEAIVMIFTASLVLAMQRNRIDAAALIVFLGMITGKILFGVMFFPLFLTSKNLRKIFYWGILPAIVFLIPYSLAGYIIGGKIPFIGFSPESTTFCLSIFSLAQNYIDISGPLMKWGSASLVIVSYIAIWKYRSRFNLADFPGVAFLTLIMLFLLFYHITPEYLVFALPLMAILPIESKHKREMWIFNSIHGALALTSTGFGIMYGLRIYSQGFGYKSPSKDAILKIYRELFGNISPALLEQLLLTLSIMLLAVMLFITLRHLRSGAAFGR